MRLLTDDRPSSLNTVGCIQGREKNDHNNYKMSIISMAEKSRILTFCAITKEGFCGDTMIMGTYIHTGFGMPIKKPSFQMYYQMNTSLHSLCTSRLTVD